MKQITRFFCFVLISCFFFTPVFAYRTIDSSGTLLASTTEPTGLSTADIQTTTGTFIKASLALVGTVFLGLMVYGGFLWMTARGAEDQITKSKETIVAAMIGIAIILAAYAITNFVTSGLISKSSNSAADSCTNELNACLTSCPIPAANAGAGAVQANQACRNSCDEANIQCTQSSL
jgi:hypothetical protein